MTISSPIAASIAAVVLVVSLCASLLPLVHAHPENQTQIPNGANAVRNGVAWPALGHLVANDTGPINSFGIAFQNHNGTWSSAFCNEDTDGDGYSNGAELGDPDCVWTMGDVPERFDDISHPGFTDSYPTFTTLSWRIVGPNPLEGVLQSRLYPKPWGTVNFGFTDTDWAIQYCNITRRYNESLVPRAWLMAQRLPEDQQYLTENWYVTLSDVVSCTGPYMDDCAYSYSDPGVPQNSTKAETNAIYVKCDAFVKGQLPDYPPLRLVSSDPHRGYPEAKNENGTWSNVWIRKYVTASPEPEDFVCGVIFGYNTTVTMKDWKLPVAYKHDYKAPYPWSNITIRTCDPWGDILGCEVEHIPRMTTVDGYRCAPTQPSIESFSPGSSKRALIFTIHESFENGTLINETTWREMVIDSFGLTEDHEVVIPRWNHDTATELIHGAMHINSTAINPNNALYQMVAPYGAYQDTFNILGFRYETIPEPALPSEIPEFRIDGIQPGEGVLQARYGAGPWGLVHWSTTSIYASQFCERSGTLNGNAIPQLTRIKSENVNLTSPYMPANNYLIISDNGGCYDKNNISTCSWLYSDPTVPRYLTAYDNALYVRCSWTSLPKVRMSGYMPCQGIPQIKVDGGSQWWSTKSEFSHAQMCNFSGCPCDVPGEGSCSTATSYGGFKVWSDFIACNLTEGRIHECDVQIYDEEKAVESFQSLRCGINTPSNPWFPGEYQTYGLAQILPNATKAQFEEFLDDRWNYLEYKNITYFGWEVNNDTEQLFVNFSITNENPRNPVIESSFGSYLRSSSPFPVEGMPTSYSDLTGDGPFFMPPLDPKPTPFEYKLVGPREHEGWLMARWPGGEWGHVASESYDSSAPQVLAVKVCNETGHYQPGMQARVYTGISTSYGVDGIDGAKDYWSVSAYVSLWQWSCSINFAYNNVLQERCRFMTNELKNESWNSLAHEALYFKCDLEPYRYRLLGAFPGVGTPQFFEETQQTWLNVYSTSAYAHMCERFFKYDAIPGHNPFGQVDPALGGGSFSVRLRNYGCNPYDASIEFCSLTWTTTSYSGGAVSQINCYPPPPASTYAGTSVQMMNGAIAPDVNVTKERFIAMAAEIAGTAESNIILTQWNEQRSATADMVYTTIRIDDTSINVGVAMAQIKANTTFGWLRSDIRPIPVPNAVPEVNWDWAIEKQTEWPYRGFVAVRPTSHYPYGVPCAATWSGEHTKTYCATMFGAAILTWPVDPTVKRVGVGGTREVFLQNMFCLAGETDVRQCSYQFLSGPTALCPGTENIYVDCRPATATGSITPSLSGTVTFSPSLSLSATLTITASPSVPPTRTQTETITPPPTATPTASRTVTPAPTRTRSKDLPTPAPPTPSPPPPPPTPVPPTPQPPTPMPPPPPPPSRTATRSLTPVTRSQSLSIPLPTDPPSPLARVRLFVKHEKGAAGIAQQGGGMRPGDTARIGVTAELLHAQLRAGAPSSPMQVTFAFGASLALASCGAELPDGCRFATTAAGAGEVACTNVAGSDFRQYFTVDVALRVPAAGFALPALADVVVSLRVANWSAFAESDFHVVAPWTRQALSLPIARSTPAAAPFVVESMSPDPDGFEPGTTVTMTGSGLQRLPAAVPIGSWLATVSVNAAGTSATMVIPSTGVGLSTADAAAESNSTGASVRAALRAAYPPASAPDLPVTSARYLACGVLNTESLAAIAAASRWWLAEHNGTADTASELLRRFAVDWAGAQVSVRPLPAQVPDTTVTGARNLNINGSDPRVVIPVFVPGVADVSDEAVATLDDGTRSVGVATEPAQTPVYGPDGTRIGTWVAFVFPQSNATDASTYVVEHGVPATDGSGDLVTRVRPAPGTTHRTINVTVYDPASHVTTTDSRILELPTLRVEVRKSGPHRLQVAITVASAPEVERPRIIAYADEVRSLRAFPVKGTTGRCSYKRANLSTACQVPMLYRDDVGTTSRRQQQSGAGPRLVQWKFDLYSAAPHYYTQDVAGWLHVRSDTAAWLQLAVVFTAGGMAPSNNGTNGGGSGGVSVAVGGGGGSPLSLNNGTVPPGDGPSGPVGPPSGAPASLGEAMQRGIFGYSGGCDGTEISFVAATLLAYVLLVAALLVWSANKRRNARSDIPDRDTHVTTNVTPMRALLRSHIYGGAVRPCHHYCAPVHATTLLLHVLVLYAVAAALVNAYPELVLTPGSSMPETVRGILAIGGLVAAVSALTLPIFALPFSMYRIVDERPTDTGKGRHAAYQPQDLMAAGAQRKMDMFGVSQATERHLHAIDDFDALAPGSFVPDATERYRAGDDDGNGGDWTVEDIDFAYEGGGVAAGYAGPDQAAVGSTTSGSTYFDDVVPTSSGGGGGGGGGGRPLDGTMMGGTMASSSKPQLDAVDGSSSLNADTAAGHQPSVTSDDCQSTRTGHDSAVVGVTASCCERSRVDCVIVESVKYTIAGYLFCAVAALALVTQIATVTAPWCAAEMSAFRDVMLVAVLVDAVAAQSIYVGLVHAWRWVSQEGDEDDEDDESVDGDHPRPRAGCLGVLHELHPIDGQWRFVGPLVLNHMGQDDVDE